MAKIKNTEILSCYEKLNTLNLISIEDETMISLWYNIKMLKKKADEYKSERKQAETSLVNDDEHEANLNSLRTAYNKEVNAKNGSYTLTNEDKAEAVRLSQYFTKVGTKRKALLESIDSHMVEIEPVKIKDTDLLKALKANGKDFSFMEGLEWMTVE